jgi:hypothetical protein
MTVKSRILNKGLNGIIVLAILLLTGIYSCVRAQSQTITNTRGGDIGINFINKIDCNYSDSAKIMSENLEERIVPECLANPSLNDPALYLGYEIAPGSAALSLKSSVNKIDGLRIPFYGARVGGIISNTRGKLKAHAGIYYSDDSAPYDFDMLEGGVSTSIYLLRLRKPRYHTLEPYVVADLTYQVMRYYGSYVANSIDAGKDNDPLLGNTATSQLRVGMGFEYQLENNDNKFLHFFAEAGLGIPLSSTFSNESLSNTRAINQIWLTIGVDFGLINKHFHGK